MASAAVAARVTSQLQQRADEQELLFRGEQYRQAIRSYYETGLPRRFPRRLEELLKDPRFLSIRHIRKLSDDPLSPTGADWGLVLDESGGIVGVFSQSERKPIKRKGFASHLQHFEDAESYRDWTFVFEPSGELQLRSRMPLLNRSEYRR